MRHTTACDHVCACWVVQQQCQLLSGTPLQVQQQCQLLSGTPLQFSCVGFWQLNEVSFLTMHMHVYSTPMCVRTRDDVAVVAVSMHPFCTWCLALLNYIWGRVAICRELVRSCWEQLGEVFLVLRLMS